MRLFISILLLIFTISPLFSEEIFIPYNHRAILRKNVDRGATLELVSRNPQRFENIMVGFEGHILKIKETGKKKITTYLLCSNMKNKFIASLKGKSDRFMVGVWVETYGKIKNMKTPFKLNIPVVKAIRVFTPEDVEKDAIRKKDLNYFLLAEKNGGFLKFGKKLFKKKYYRDSEIIFKFGLKYDKKRKKELYYYQLAKIKFIEKKYDEAQKYCNMAIDLNMEMVKAQFLLGRVEIKLKKYSKALRYFNRSIKLKSKENPWKYISKIYFLKGEYKKSLKYIDVAIVNNPDDEELNLMAGNINLKLGHLEIAAAYYRKYLKKFPNSTEVRYNLFQTEKIEKDFKKEITTEEYRKYRRILKNSLSTIGIEYNPLLGKKFFSKIIEKELLWAVRYKATDYKLYNYLGLINLYRGDYETGRKFFELSIKCEKNRSTLYYNLAFSDYFCNKFNEAIKNFNKAYSLDSLMDRAIKYKKMVLKFQKLLKKNKNWMRNNQRSKIHREFGEYLYTKNKIDLAEFQYLESLRFRNDNFGTIFDIIYLKYKSDKKDEADSYVKKLFIKSKLSKRYYSLLRKIGYSQNELKLLGFKGFFKK